MKTLDLYITKLCNLNCEYCYVDIIKDESPFSYEDFSQRIKLLDFEHIKFFGWEPLIKWWEIKQIVLSVKQKNQNIKFTIVTNGLLITHDIIQFCKLYWIEVVVSVHKKGLARLKDKFNSLLEINNLVCFSFVFEGWNLFFPCKVFDLLQKYWFKNFIFSPEVFSNWNDRNISELKKELIKIEKIFWENWWLNIKWIDWEKLKDIVIWCEKIVVSKDWEKQGCNRFSSLNIFESITYRWIYDLFDEYINLYSDKNKWFYICPIWWYLDSLKTNIWLKERIFQYKELNECFIHFSQELNRISWKLNFLSDRIDEIRFNLTSQCNLRCEYCYVDFKDEILDEKTAKNIIDFFLMQDGKKKTISFFWGEPLLEFNLLKELVRYSKEWGNKMSKEISFKIATNFLLSNDEIVKFLVENNFEVHISLNWEKYLNDKMRSNSTDLLLRKLNTYRSIIWVHNIVILLAFSHKEITSLWENISYIYELWFSRINLELIFWEKYSFMKKDFLLLKKELMTLKNSEKKIDLINLRSKNRFLDISTQWRVDENSFEFNKYPINIVNKKLFDWILSKIFL